MGIGRGTRCKKEVNAIAKTDSSPTRETLSLLFGAHFRRISMTTINVLETSCLGVMNIVQSRMSLVLGDAVLGPAIFRDLRL